jgi:hypothetical protein
MSDSKPEANSMELEVYVPDFNLQGDYFPFYIVSKNKIQSVTINYTNGLSPKEIYNAKPESVELGDSSITVRGFNVEGYLGGMFNTSFDKVNYGKSESISFEVKFDGEESKSSKTIELFRPDVSVDPGKKVLNISTHYNNKNKTEHVSIDSPIPIINRGPGASLVSIETQEDNQQVKLSLPQYYIDVVENLMQDLTNSLSELSEKYPHYQEYLVNIIEMAKHPIPTRETAAQYQDAMQNFGLVLESNPEFKDDFFTSFIGAVVRNISVTKEMQTFLAYLMSIKPHKMILLNPLVNITLPKGSYSFDLIIRQTDLLKNFYDNIIINVEVNCDKDVNIPISDLFDFRKGEIN